MRKYFGTDGIRGVVGKELTAEIGYRVGAAGAYVLKKMDIAQMKILK